MISKFILIVACSALAYLILLKELLEEQSNFEEEVYKAGFVAATGTVLNRTKHYFAASITLSVVIFIGMTERF